MQRHALLLWTVVASGCAATFPQPLTANQLATYRSAPAVVAYLGQADASAAVCDLGSAGPHLVVVDQDIREALANGLREGTIPPPIWRDCVADIVRSGDQEGAAAMLDVVSDGYRALLTDGRVETSAVWQQRLVAAHDVLADRPPGVNPHALSMATLRSELQRVLSGGGAGPVARSNGEDLRIVLDLERGVLRGRSVDLPLLDDLATKGDETTLRRAADRLPDGKLRDEARRRVIRLHIDASPFAEVRAGAASVEQLMMTAGNNRVALADHPPVRGWIEPQAPSPRAVLVRQNVVQQTATLLGLRTADFVRASVLPASPLRDAIRVELEGISRPVTVCAPPKELDPSPCLQPQDVALDSAVAFMDGNGLMRFRDGIRAGELIALAGAERLTVPVTAAGKPVATLDWPLRFESPKDLTFAATAARPDDWHLRVRLERSNAGRLIYAVTQADRQSIVVVESADAGAFHVISQGARGRDGSDGAPGSDGRSGQSGWSASCPSSSGSDGERGSDGSDGGPGGDGGDGSNGGNILIEVACGEGTCLDLSALAAKAIVSRGGAGGHGGQGGRGGSGGRGGAGGSGTTCTDSEGNTSSLSGGFDGTSGFDGRS
ncbi:MAG: hypothetical protein QOI66_1514, partial [Myxococcales bacterium]|nr:hypothetical protein [Myxococcales bacterium]